MPVNSFVKGGRFIPTGFDIISWKETGMRFHNRDRLQTRGVVLHTTGAENPPAAVYTNMLHHKNKAGGKEPLSVHFVIDQLGHIYQMADADVRCAHAGPDHDANGWSVGIEIICRLDNQDVPDKGVHREMVTDTIHGKPCTYANVTTAQQISAIRLSRALCHAYALPFQVPVMASGELWTTAASDTALVKRYRGVLPHYWLKKTKRDPGVRLMKAVWEATRQGPLVA